MKKFTITLFTGLLMFATTINAQEKKEKNLNSIEAVVEKMATDLELNDTEVASVKSLLEKHNAEKKQFNKENERKSEDYKPKMKELQLKQADELKAILGDEKFKKYQVISNEERKAKKKNQESQ